MEYEHTAGAGAEEFDPGGMGTTPAFVRQSDTLQLQRTEPLFLKLAARDPYPQARFNKMAQGHALFVHTNTAAPRPFPVVTSADLRFPAVGGREPERYHCSQAFPRPEGRREPITAQPGQTVLLPDLATLGFPHKRSWSEDDLDAVLELRLEGVNDAVLVDMGRVPHGCAR